MNIIYYATIAAAAYFLGCSNPAWVISKLKGVDMRSGGSGNLGTCNSVIMLGMRWGVIVCIYDMGKAALSVLLASWLLPELIFLPHIAGVACICGHIFPFYLKFRGGKGFASFLGMVLALDWRFAIVLFLIVVLVTVLTDHIVYATALAVLLAPLYLWLVADNLIAAAIVSIASAVILWKHRENFSRLKAGTEISLRQALKDKTNKAA